MLSIFRMTPLVPKSCKLMFVLMRITLRCTKKQSNLSLFKRGCSTAYYDLWYSLNQNPLPICYVSHYVSHKGYCAFSLISVTACSNACSVANGAYVKNGSCGTKMTRSFLTASRFFHIALFCI